ncbi:MAG: type I DNA topoisomerase [Succinivibrionaceae bacterium]|nr:type I DNA topoisomerase [Succinivibrionaceae bacterium]
MGKSLVIVESPAKVKTISKYLGGDYVVESSVGHVRDLPLGKTKIKVARNDRYGPVKKLGIDPEKGWKPTYEILEGKEEVVRKLKKQAANADNIYLATDLDREGEAIAWHLQQIIGGDKSRFKRVTFNEITKDAIQKAFSSPTELDINKVNAQQTRRFLDKIVGFLVSPVLWQKVAKKLSAGRVQSIAVELIVDREREIGAFVCDEYWDVKADFLTGEKKAKPVSFELVKKNKLEIGSKAAADAVIDFVKAHSSEAVIDSIEQKPTESRPPAPFITSTLQQAASNRLGFSVKHTMAVAQMLYEAGYITYMRTDSTNLSGFALGTIRAHIEANYGKDYLPEKPNFYGSSNKEAQEAHEAIRSTNVDLAPQAVKIPKFASDGQKLYALIRDRSVASQMKPARYMSTTAVAKVGQYRFRASGRVTVFEGWTRVLPVSGSEVILPALSQGDALTLADIGGKQHFTMPPARYTEASLVKELESRGIGRPSTYAEIISKIQERGYVRLQQRKFYAEKIGAVVVDRLKHSFSALMQYNFTRDLEGDLDRIAEGSVDWVSKLDDFYDQLSEDIANAKKPDGMPENRPVPVENFKCPSCGRAMEVRIGATGLFLGCTGYRDETNTCTKTLNLNLVERKNLPEADEEKEFSTRSRCEKCGRVMDEYLIDSHTKLFLCSDAPNCAGHRIETGDYDVTTANMYICDKCGSPMTRKVGRFGPYAECTNAQCGERRSIQKNQQLAPPKEPAIDFPELPCEKSEGSHFVLRNSSRGIFFAAHDYPAHREARPVKVAELQRFRDRLPEKLQYLAAAPLADPEGNPAVVRYSVKTKQQYVGSLKNDKPTKWQAFYKNGVWTVPAPKEK